MKDIAEFYKYLHKKNNGIFYRSNCAGKKEQNAGYKLGFGKYYTWEKGMAEAFGKVLCGEGNFTLEKTKLSINLKLLDSGSRTFCDMKEELGFKCWDNIGNEFAARILSHKIKQKGYDGAISDEVADGICIF